MSKSKKALKRELRKFDVNFNQWSNRMFELYQLECEESNLVIDESNYPYSRWLCKQFAERFSGVLGSKLNDGDWSVLWHKYNFYFGLRMALFLNNAEREKVVDLASDSFDRFESELYGLQHKVEDIYENI